VKLPNNYQISKRFGKIMQDCFPEIYGFGNFKLSRTTLPEVETCQDAQ
jgi:hypothetical protein